ncbi:MAG: stage V sporulation T C-terminal domain-containing protein [Firmicutes bacterium]|jgi:AbrB family transcriptional regulator (stage V sporulation protein T)|nr:stage V sporulation T C-terminal domain-containing protein [Bacillota bacterium]MDD4336506.1 stage V sporulation T C-terminal domain-containing protein [Bacillota bacterium]MDD4791778.1 stage V sporulation T C-terminal domain-containing protein [Bacillota bacterium]
MRATGIVRRIDELGRIVVPKELRRSLRIHEGDSVEIYVDPKGSVVLKKYSPVAQLKDVASDMAESLSSSSGDVALICDRDTVVAASGPHKEELLGRRVGRAVEKAMVEKQALMVHFSGGGDASSILANEGPDSIAMISAAIAPIIADGDSVGAVIVGTTSNDSTVGDLEESLAITAAGYLARQVA